MTPWQAALTQMRCPDAAPPIARDDRDDRIYHVTRALIASSHDGRVRMAEIVKKSRCKNHIVVSRIYSNSEFTVTKRAGDRQLWVSMAAPRRGRA